MSDAPAESLALRSARESGFATPDPVDPNIIWSTASGSGSVGGIVVKLIVNLLPQGIRWTPDGLQLARRLAADALRDATTDGWEPASIGEPFRLIEGRTIGGSVVESAILSLERLA